MQVRRINMRGIRPGAIRLGQSSIGDDIGAAGGMAANALLPGSGAVVTPIIDTIAQLFGGATGDEKNDERQQHMYSLYNQAMTLPGSASSVAAVITLYNTANQINGQNNPQITRTYAQQALTRLSQQGWIDVNSETPAYVGVAPISTATGALATSSQLRAAAPGAGLSTPVLIGGLAAAAVGLALLTRRKPQAA